MTQILELTALKEFSCMGAECPVTCCSNWDRIALDEATLEKWSALDKENQELKLLDMVRVDKDGNSMMEIHNNSCAALDEDGLCKIQKYYDHDCLSEICQNFPRLKFSNRSRIYRSASLSCPVIVRTMFFSNSDDLFVRHDEKTSDNTGDGEQGGLQYDLDVLLDDIFSSKDYPLGNMLFYIADLFTTLIGLAHSGQMTEDIIQQVRQDIEENLGDISRATSEGRLAPHPVTSGSFWKNMYHLLNIRKVNERFMPADSSDLAKAINQCDDSFPAFEKVYSVIEEYRVAALPLIRENHLARMKKYARMIFVNNGFPLQPKHSHLMVLVDSMLCLSVFQILLWIEVNKNGSLDDEFIQKCIIEVDRKFVLHDGMIRLLEEDPNMMKIDKYCNVFLDLF